MLRKIKCKKLLIGGLLYRLHIILIQSVFWYLFYGYVAKAWVWEWAIGSSIIWNTLNTLLYFNWHYWFARMVKLGVNRDEE